MSFRVLLESAGSIGRITISNPPNNVLTSPVFAHPDELAAFLAQPHLKGVVVAGAGRHFCAGADVDTLRAQARDAAGFAAALNHGKRLLDHIRFAPVPVVAAVRGSCLGAGLEIALACHFRVAATSALLGFPESQHGLMPGLSGTQTGVAGRGALVRLVLSGDMIGAEEALRQGLVDRCCAPRQVEAEAAAFVEQLTARRSPELIHSTMESIHNAVRMDRASALRRETELFCALVRSASEDGGRDGGPND